jgi:hypothetical protein
LASRSRARGAWHRRGGRFGVALARGGGSFAFGVALASGGARVPALSPAAESQ